MHSNVEKTLKAVLEKYAKRVPKIHDLDKLLSEVKNYIDIESDKSVINKLNMLYIESRYPGALGFLPDGKPTSENVEEFYAFAKNIYDTVRNHLTTLDKPES
jgi:HEPN domain-containing protein